MRRDLLVEHDIVEPEHDIVGGEKLAVGPSHALAQGEGELSRVCVRFPGLGYVGDQAIPIWRPDDQVFVAHEGVEAGRPRTEQGMAHRAAILTNGLQRFEDFRIGGQTLIQGRQFAGSHHLLPLRGLVHADPGFRYRCRLGRFSRRFGGFSRRFGGFSRRLRDFGSWRGGCTPTGSHEHRDQQQCGENH